MTRTPLLLLCVLLVAMALPADAAVRLTTAVNGEIVEVAWPQSAFPIRYTPDQRLINALPGGPAALQQAFQAWQDVPNARVSFEANGAITGLKAGRDGVNTVTLADDLFANQRAIAITTNWDDNGSLTESDIQVDGSLINSNYNVHQAMTHEVGHLLGLDHSAVLSAVMFPYVSRNAQDVVLDSDDRVGIASIYPQTDPAMTGGTLRGRVTGDAGGVFAAQVVAVNEFGEAVATGLTNTAGEFVLEGMPEGTYRIYAEPLDGPVDTKNLSPYWRQGGTVISFPTQFLSGPPLTVSNGTIHGNLVVNTAGSLDLNPRWLGIAPAGKSNFNLSTTAPSVRGGETISLAVAGDGMLSGITTFEVLSPSVRRVSEFRYAANYIYADFEILPDAPAGSAVILVRRGDQTAALTGAVRIQSAETGGRGRIARR